jgi:hypothetical protein
MDDYEAVEDAVEPWTDFTIQEVYEPWTDFTIQEVYELGNPTKYAPLICELLNVETLKQAIEGLRNRGKQPDGLRSRFDLVAKCLRQERAASVNTRKNVWRLMVVALL